MENQVKRRLTGTIAGLLVLGWALALEPAMVCGQTLWNVDFEQLSSEGTYKVQMIGAGPDGGTGSAGDIWNVFEISEAGTAAPIGQGLVDSSGVAGGVTFTFTAVDAGTLGAYGHSPTAINDVVAEYLFLGDQNGAWEAMWEITGLKPGGSYDMYLYTGGYDAVNSGHNADYNIDVDGDGAIDGWTPISPGTPVPTVVNIVADGSGTILGHFGHNGVGESEIGGFQLEGDNLAPITITNIELGDLYNVDFEQLSTEGTYKVEMVGAGPNGGVGSAGDVWNVFEISEAGTAAPVGLALLDSSGAASGVSFAFTDVDSGAGWLSAYGHSPTAINDVVAEYLFLGPQNGGDDATWEITGLTAGGSYNMYLYTGGYDAVNGGHNADYNIDVDGDGAIDGWAPIAPGTPVPTVVSIIADGSGTILGHFGHNGVGESEIGGFQIAEIPEPTTMVLLGLGGLALSRRRRA